MSLRIDLEDARPFYRPGDQISGNVILDSKKSEDIAQVVVEFTGRCKVKIRRHDHYTTISHRTRGYYFRKLEIVYDGGSYTFQSGTRSWPFSFVIPLEADVEDPRSQRPASKRELDRVGILKRNDIDGLESDHFSSNPTWRGSYDSYRGRPDAHFLPDAFEYESNRFPASCEARVEYELTATLKRPTRGVLFPSKDLDVSQNIILRSWNHPKSPGYKNGQHELPYLDTQIVTIREDFAAAHPASAQGAKMSKLGRAAMNVFKPSDLHPINVDILVLLTRSFRPGQICSLRLLISLAGIGDPATIAKYEALPPVRLQSYTLRLLARTALRGKQESVMVQDVNHYAVDSKILLTGKGLDLIVPKLDSERAGTSNSDLRAPNRMLLNDGLDLSVILPSDEADRQFMTPTFKTYNINREYEFAFEMKLQCAGIRYDIKRDDIPLIILASEDYPDSSKSSTVPRSNGASAGQNGPPNKNTNTKDTLNDEASTDEKKGPVPPPPREEESEELPKYEPGDVPDYQADRAQHLPS